MSALKNLSINGGPYLNGSKQWGTSAEVKWDLGAAKLTSVTAYRKFDSSSTTVGGFTSNDTYTVGNGAPTSRPGIMPSGDHIKTFTQELRLQGTAMNDGLDWLIGGFYSSEKIRADQTMTLNADFQRTGSAFNFANAAGVNPLFALTALGNAGVPVNANGNYAENRFNQDASSWSVFTHNVLNFTDKLSLTVGARYVNETKDASFNQLAATTGAGASACQASVNGVLTGAVPAALRAGMIGINCFPFATSVALTAPAAIGGGLASAKLPLPRIWSQEFKDDEITYTAQLGYKANEDLLLYAGYSHGFKSGGFNLDPQSATLQNSGAILAGLATGTIVAPVYADPSFKSEKVNQIEVGVKATLFGAIKANLALFDMKMSDFQVLEFTGVQFLTFNVNSARSTGAELELFGKLSDNISVNASGTYANARYPSNCADGVAVAARPSTLRLCGQDLTNAPKFAGVVGVTYDGPLNDSGWSILVNGNVNYSDSRTTRTIDTDTNGLPVPFARQENYYKINARIGLTTPDERYTFELWGTNLNNEITRGITANTPLRGGAGTRSLIGFVEEPRMYDTNKKGGLRGGRPFLCLGCWFLCSSFIQRLALVRHVAEAFGWRKTIAKSLRQIVGRANEVLQADSVDIAHRAAGVRRKAPTEDCTQISALWIAHDLFFKALRGGNQLNVQQALFHFVDRRLVFGERVMLRHALPQCLALTLFVIVIEARAETAALTAERDDHQFHEIFGAAWLICVAQFLLGRLHHVIAQLQCGFIQQCQRADRHA
jgi:outer membrane receptor protein involved in Fe transport